jgi:cytochrome c peroxidase
VVKNIRFHLVAVLWTLILAAIVAGPTGHAQLGEGGFGVGNSRTFLRKYLMFRNEQLTRSPRVLSIRLGYVKGLSRSFTSMAGEATIDLESGAFTVNLNGLTPGATYSVWLVDVAERADQLGGADAVVQLATVRASGSSAVATGSLNGSASTLPAGFAIDRILVAPGTASPAEPLAGGSVNVFQKIFLRRLSLVDEGAGAVLFEERTAAPRLSNLLADVSAETEAALPLADTDGIQADLASTLAADGMSRLASTRSLRIDRLISRGATLFFEGQFGGNGRTCGTCHPASNNFTIDPKFISTLPPNDPLFVAEFNPALAGLERPQLMRRFGLILENLDGLDDPTNKFVMRGVPHTLGLQVSLERDTSLANPPTHMIGWSGDGAPGTGSLREFAIGAVTQHLTRSLERVTGRDFRLPTEHQLDAMEAFQLSLGRAADYDLTKLTFQNAGVEKGKSLFMNGTGDPAASGSCGFCHLNAGALSVNLQNRNFDSGVESVAHPARMVEDFPKDGGFGQTDNLDGTYGDRSFNIASVVEAADTGPFFHNNLVDTLEGVVEFYSSPAFNDPLPASARINFNAMQTRQIANFMRGVNVLQDIDVAREELAEVLANRFDAGREREARLRTAYEEVGDAIGVLKEGGIFPSAVTHLTAARDLVKQAQRAILAARRRMLVQQANGRLGQARNAVAAVVP